MSSRTVLIPALVLVGCASQTDSREVIERMQLANSVERSSDGLLKVYATPDGQSPSLSLVLTRQAPGFVDAAYKTGLFEKLKRAGFKEVTVTTEVGLSPAFGKRIHL